MEITHDALAAAARRGQRMTVEYGATSVRYDEALRLIRVQLASGRELLISPDAVASLQGAAIDDLAGVRLSPSRLGLYFPALDVDLSIPNLYHSEDGRHICVV